MPVKIITADYIEHADAIVFLLDYYAKDPMGGGKVLSSQVKANVVSEMAKMPQAFSVLAFVDDEPASLINSFVGFSTFNAKPLVNIHDVIVHADFRGLGLSQMMLAKVEKIAKDMGCCKLTLEVLSKNIPAQHSYKKFGFNDYELDHELGKALFWQKLL